MPFAIVLLKPGKLPKTSSGKVQRRECREQFLADQLDSLACWRRGDAPPPANTPVVNPIESEITSDMTPATAIQIQTWLVNRISDQLKIPHDNVDIDATFAHFGIDSVALMGISGELEDWLGFTVSPKLLFNHPTIAELSACLAASENPDRSHTPAKSELTRADRFPKLRDPLMRRFGGHQQPTSDMLHKLDGMSDAEIDAMLLTILNQDPGGKRQLLAQLITRQARLDSGRRALSHGQRALWFIYQMDRESSAYNIMSAAHVPADFDRAAFSRAFQTILNRHEVLRSSYGTENGLPVQIVRAGENFELQTIDGTDWNQDQLDLEIQAAADFPFDLENGPIIRVQLFERDASDHVLLITVHHIALDFWALDLLYDELEILYRAEVTGNAARLPSCDVAYADFVSWQQQSIDGSDGQEQWKYWREQLAGNLPVLDLPADFPRPAIQSFRGKSFRFNLPKKLSRQLMELAKSEDVTLFATMLAAFKVLLFRYSGQNDILVGTPTAGRSRSEFEKVFGYCVNPIVLRSRLSADEPFTKFLSRVRRTLVDGITNQDFPFPLLVEKLQVPRDASRSPVFQVAFGWEKPRKLHLDELGSSTTNGKLVDSGSLGLRPFAFAQQGSAFDLMLMGLNVGEEISAAFQYNLDLFEESTIVHMSTHFLMLLESIVDDPECPLGDFPLLTETEKQLLLNGWNDITTDYPSDICLHELFETQVQKTPDAVAVECNDQRLSYRELDERANQVANYLKKFSVGPEVCVGVYVERSIGLLVGLLGVLKAGAAYVPLTPGTPANRLEYMLREMDSHIVVTEQKLAENLPESCGKIVCLDGDWATIAKEAKIRKGRGASPTNLAYVMFTSGSTGKPKGVQIEHRGVVNFLTSMQRRPGISSDDVLLAVTTFAFDISVLELFLPLTVGAKVVVVCNDVAADGVQLTKAIEEAKITIMQATPATWRLLVEAGWSGDRRMKVLCGGEAFPSDLAEPLLQRCGSLWNMYGPTETTVWSAVDEVTERMDPMPIGRPIANTQIYVLDNQLQPVPIGVTGHLYIGGDGVARGYLNHSELTTEKFIDSPFGDHARLYRTGDLARYRPDGKIEFLGREDFQVKIRGFRIELEEIESRLTDHLQIRQAVVTARQCDSKIKDRQLIAYFTHHEVPNTSELRDFLKEDLPDYMVPSVFVPIDEFPLNSAGKIDRSQLPQPNSARPDLRDTWIAPRNPTEQKLSEIWSKVLGLDEVGVHDNFFELGGASMQSLEITTLARDFGMELLPAMLFKHPTIAELAASGLFGIETGPADAPEPLDDQAKPSAIASCPATNGKARPVNSQSLSKTKTDKSNLVIESIGVYLPPEQ